jgi:Iron-containing redox enzyme
VPPSQSELLRAKIALVWPELAAAGRKLLTHPRVVDLYPEYLITCHGIVRASVPLMAAALERSEALAGSDRVAAGLVEYFREHIPEERDHDEWVLEDLEVLGIERSAVLTPPPSVTVAALVGAQYYWIFHYHPVALVGYIMLLEGYPPLRNEIEGLIERTGHSARAFRTLLHHADLDPDHGAELDRTLDHLPLSTEHAAVVGLSAMQSVHLVARAVEEIVDDVRAVP